MNLRKLLSILLSLTMLLTLAGCQIVEDPDDGEDEVVGGGLVQARDGEETNDIEVEDPYVEVEDPYYGDEDPVEVEEPITDTAEEEDIIMIELAELSDIAPEEGVSFYALVVSVGTNSLNVCGFNTTVNDVNHVGLFTVSLSDDATVTGIATSIEDITAGDIVVITYDGEVMETYPAQISGATRIYVDDHASRLAEIEYLLPDGYEDFGNYFPAWDEFEY
ncbi:MAG: hypothetical protein LUE20_06740 [Oscillospiraceae bacterium]|nr:hypothetical protein [Oscillospiraceae bacterium]